MKAAYDAGVNFFDCAETYADGESEKVMGEAIKKYGWKRNDLVISTKVCLPVEALCLPKIPHADQQIYWGASFGSNRANNVGLSRKHIVEGLNQSLERLQLEYVDLVYAHRPDRQTPMEEIVRAFNHVINQGKAFYWGTSEWSADEIAMAWRHADRLGLIGPVMEQPEYNMINRAKVESEFAHLYREVGLGLTTFSPLRLGLLTGKYRDGVPADSRLAQTQVAFIAGIWKRLGKEHIDDLIAKVRQLEPIAERLGVKQSVLSLAWVIRNPNVSSAIMGASRPEQVYENIQALEVYKKLTPEILEEIDTILNNKPPAIVERF